MEKTIYVGMALTTAPEEFRVTFEQELKQSLRQLADTEILDFIGLENGSNIDVSRHDKKCTQESDLCVFILDYPSTGLGKEIAYREAVNKPALYFAKEGVKVTRMVLGELDEQRVILHRYNEVADIIKVVESYLPTI